MSARRWPVVTLSLILVNMLIFATTHKVVDRQDSQISQVHKHILVLAARHPALLLTPEVDEYVAGFRSEFPDDWAEMQDSKSEPVDEWDARIRQMDDTEALQRELDSLEVQCSQLTASSITRQYAFTPAHPKPISYLTSTFLHVDWWHVLGNVWFLWLAGFVLEDVWGRPLYLIVYLAAGVMAHLFNLWANPGSIVPSVGASGAIAGLMGAFFVRFFKMRIRMMWLFDLGLYPFSRFWIRAYWILPFWALAEVNAGMRPRDGIGHWAHVGGFLCGTLVAVGLRYSGLEHKVDRAIEQKVSWTPDAEIAQANELMERGELAEAAVVLNRYLEANRESFAAWNLLRAVHWRASNISAYREATAKLCGLHLKAKEWKPAWEDYEDFLSAGGERMRPSVWIEVCRAAEEQQLFDRAASEYEQLAAVYPSERESLLAQVRAARLYLHELSRPQDALRPYRAASSSAVPHLDLEPEIQSGVREAAAALSESRGASAAAGSAAG